MNGESLATLQPEGVREALPPFLASYIADPTAAAANRARIAEAVGRWPIEGLRALIARLATDGHEHRVYRADPLARELARLWLVDVISATSLGGVEHLAAAADAGPTLIVGNHLSYIDTSVTDALLTWAGFSDLADRLVTVAGPKVYADPFRKLAALGLNTLLAPQSTRLGHTAQLPARELARRAVASLGAARAALADRLILQIYPEGSRSRTGRLRPFIKGVHRYLSDPDIRVVPAAIVGTDELMAVHDTRIQCGAVGLSYGRPLRVGDHDSPRDALVAAHAAVAALLPDSRRPDPGEPVLQ